LARSGFAFARRFLHTRQELAVVDLGGVVVLDVAVLAEADDDAPPLRREHADTRGHEHPQRLATGGVAPRAQHDVGRLRVEVAEVRGQVERREAAAQADVARLIVELRFDLVGGGVLGSVFEPLCWCGEGRNRERRNDQEIGR